MYWISGAFRAVRWAPHPRSSEIAPFSTAFPPVPTAFPEDVPSPRPVPGAAFALTLFPREGGISRRDRSGAGTDGSGGPRGGRGGEGGGGLGRAPSTIPGRGVGKSAERGRSVRSTTITSVGRCGVQGIIDASTSSVKWNRAETGTQFFSKWLLGKN